MRTRGPLIIKLSKTKHKYGSDKEIRKKLVEPTPHRVTFLGRVSVFDGGWVQNNKLNCFFSSACRHHYKNLKPVSLRLRLYPTMI